MPTMVYQWKQRVAVPVPAQETGERLEAYPGDQQREPDAAVRC